MLPVMADVVVYGLYQLAQYGLSLKYGAQEATALALVAVCNRVVAAGQDHMPVKLFV